MDEGMRSIHASLPCVRGGLKSSRQRVNSQAKKCCTSKNKLSLLQQSNQWFLICPHWDEQKHTFLTRLINPLEAASVEIELRQLLRHHRPWVLLAERVRGKWSEEGRTVELSRILERLDAVDDAIVMGSPRILSMIEDVSPMRNIEPILVEIERRNSDRLQALQGMMEMLSERGWDISSLDRGTIYERFEEADTNSFNG